MSHLSQFRTDSVSDVFEGQTLTYTFLWREPMEYVEELLVDSILVQQSQFYPVKKWLHHNGKVTRLYDEPWTGERWWNNQVSLMSFFETRLTEVFA
jgi:hypothetical protein